MNDPKSPSPSPREHSGAISLLANPLSVLGGWLAGLALVVILFLMAVEITAKEPSPYLGIITFVLLPAVLVVGLLLAAIGAWRERRRRARGETDAHWPVLDFNSARQRKVIGLVTISAVVFLGLSAFGSFKAYEYTETNEFCGTVCHEAMEPEFTAYQNSAHARVHCVECHIGPGAEWFVRSKLSGAYQVYAVLADKVPRPIHTPIKNLRPSQDTCENCHWPEKFFGNNHISRNYYLSDDDNTHVRVDLLLRVGGGDGRMGPQDGIHWHMNIANKIEYIANDERRQEIDWVRSTRLDGSVQTWVNEESDLTHGEVPEGEIRTMDCIDCHNRPSHRFLPPQVAVNAALARGQMSLDLPSIKAVAVEVLEDEYETKEDALAAIEETLRDTYAGEAYAADLEPAIAKVQDIYSKNYFPRMKADWKAFPENIGHMWAPGCFRCHDGYHASPEGETLTRDCNVCHVILAEEPADGGGTLMSLVGVNFQHPEDIDLAWQEMSCTDCHAP